jgi:hypothetical protein
MLTSSTFSEGDKKKMFENFTDFSSETLKDMKAYVGDLKVPLRQKNIGTADSNNWEGVVCYCNSSLLR